MKSSRLADYLPHMQQAAIDAASFVEGMDKAGFLSKKRTQNTAIMSLLVIGEAATEILSDYPEFTGHMTREGARQAALLSHPGPEPQFELGAGPAGFADDESSCPEAPVPLAGFSGEPVAEEPLAGAVDALVVEPPVGVTDVSVIELPAAVPLLEAAGAAAEPLTGTAPPIAYLPPLTKLAACISDLQVELPKNTTLLSFATMTASSVDE